MHQNINISVVIPCFDRVRFIGSAIDSLLQGTLEPDEVIVIDDGSSDGSRQLVHKYVGQGTVRLLQHPNAENRGQAASLNLGLREAKGELICILDSDDMISPTKLERQVQFLRENPDVGMVYGQGHAVDEKGNFLFRLLPEDHTEPSDPNRLLLDCYMALPGGALVRKSVWDQVGYFEESFRAAQDHDMALRLMEATPVAYLPELAFYYRKHGDSISQNSQERRWLTGFEILDRARKRYPYRRSTIRKRRAVLNFRLGQTYWRQNRTVKSLPYFIRAGCLDPRRAFGVLSVKDHA